MLGLLGVLVFGVIRVCVVGVLPAGGGGLGMGFRDGA